VEAVLGAPGDLEHVVGLALGERLAERGCA